MPHRDWKLRIKDIVDAINAIQGYTEGIQDAEAGRVITTEELLERMDQWAK